MTSSSRPSPMKRRARCSRTPCSSPPLRSRTSAARYADYSQLTDQWGRPGASQPSQVNSLHSGTLSDDGERFYVAGTTAGMYILDTEKIAHNTNAQIAAGGVCNQHSTNAWIDG